MKHLIKKYVCPGCTSGCDITCGNAKIYDNTCQSHVPGTSKLSSTGIITFALGLPIGFNRIGETKIYCFEKKEELWDFDKFNILLWKYQYGNDVLLRIAQPRRGEILTAVIENSTVDDFDGLLISDEDIQAMD